MRIENEILMHFRNVKKSSCEVYISEPVEGDTEGNAFCLMDVFSDEDSIIDGIDLKMKTEQLYGYIEKSLNSREIEIINLRYGLRGIQPLTQREIATKLKISRSYVSRIEKKALLTLKDCFPE